MTKPVNALSDQLQVAEFNLKAMRAELERTRTLLQVARAADSLKGALNQSTQKRENELAVQVRDGALSALNQLFHPSIQIIQEGPNGQDRDLGQPAGI